MPELGTYTTRQLCDTFRLARTSVENLVRAGLIAAPAVGIGETRRWSGDDAVRVGIFASALRSGMSRKHAAWIAGQFAGLLNAGRGETWLFARPSEVGSAEDEARLIVNFWQVAPGAPLPRAERSLPGERRAAFRTLVSDAAIVINVSHIVERLKQGTAYG